MVMLKSTECCQLYALYNMSLPDFDLCSVLARLFGEVLQLCFNSMQYECARDVVMLSVVDTDCYFMLT